MTIDFEVHQRAEELYVLEGLSLEKVAEATGAAEVSVKRWSTADGWVAKRREYRKAQGEIGRLTVLYRLEILQEAMKTRHPQHAFAWAAVERAAVDKAVSHAAPAGPVAGDREIVTAEDAAEALREAVVRKLHIMLSRPEEINVKAVMDMQKAIPMIEEMKAKVKSGPAGKKQLDPETIRIIKEDIYGIA